MARSALSSKVIKETIKDMRGVFAVHKPKNTTTTDVKDMVRLQISDDVGFSIKSKGILFYHSGLMEYPAEGVLVLGLGMSAKNKMRYFLHGEKKYNVTIKLGQATDTHDALGTITEEKPYDHINRIQVEETIKQFVGPIILPLPHIKVLLMDGVQIANPEKERHDCRREINVTVSNISCIDFNPPYLSLEVLYNHRFLMRTFVHELGKALGSCAHISSMERTLQGVFTSKDALPTYRWSWSCIQENIANMRDKSNDYVNKMRLLENAEKENIST